MAQLQAVVKQVTYAQQALTSRLQHNCGVTWGVAGGIHGAHSRQDLGAVLEGAEPLTEQRDRLARRR
jgi:hypothetical protein